MLTSTIEFQYVYMTNQVIVVKANKRRYMDRNEQIKKTQKLMVTKVKT